MTVYDFDGTIYAGDSSIDFWMYCLRNYPKILCALPPTLVYFLLFKLHLAGREEFKAAFYRFLHYVPDVPGAVCGFWDIHISGIKGFYRRQHRTDDVVISAAPEFLVSEACRRLGVVCIASKVNHTTGELEGANCRGEEKVRRFRQIYPDTEIQAFYTDSASDWHMAKEAQRAFLVRNDSIEEWRI